MQVCYQASDGWGKLRCGKKCHTRSIKRIIPSILQSLLPQRWLGGAPQAILQIAIDMGRNTLFTRTATAVQAFHLEVPPRPGCTRASTAVLGP